MLDFLRALFFSRKIAAAEAQQLVDAYGRVLARKDLPYSDLWGQGKLPTPEDILSADAFAFSGGRNLSELPASKRDLREALTVTIRATPPGRLRDQLIEGYVLLAQFQDVDACRRNGQDPGELRRAEEDVLSHDAAEFGR